VDWHDWMRNDKTLLAALMLAFLAAWWVTRNDKLFDLITTFQGALIALITGEVLRRRNGSGTQDAPK
jgi:hypothetical protein